MRRRISREGAFCFPVEFRKASNSVRHMNNPSPRRWLPRFLAAVALLFASPAAAAEALKYAAAPSWVVDSPVPAAAATGDRPIEILLHDQQILVERGKTTTFSRLALQIRTPDGLTAGNISMPWQPDRQSLTINGLQIRRGTELIDVLAAGQTFTTMRRESNLEAAMLDGQLTANIQPEGLRVGDTIILSATVEDHDPVTKDHVQLLFGDWNGAPIRSARARLVWPADLDLKFRFSGGLAPGSTRTESGKKILELSMADVEPLIAPKGAPSRFSFGRVAEATSFNSWADVAELMAPLYTKAAVVPPSGSLRAEVDKIKSARGSQLAKAQMALELVQGRVRYVALSMGQGNYVPATAEETWARRYGDCKAKTALLLAILHELAIEAAPAAVHSVIGDALPDRLPMVGAFDHVLVQARIGGKSYWLDGTRTGDGGLERIPVPGFRWALPLIARGQLVALAPPPLSEPASETSIDIDATAGVRTAAPVKIDIVFRGDEARAINMLLSSASGGQRDQLLREYWKERYDFVEPATTGFRFDQSKSELHLSMAGEAKLDWSGGYFSVPHSSLTNEPDFDRGPGPARDAPFAIAYPNYWKAQTTVRLPPGFLRGQQPKMPDIQETLARVEYSRSVRAAGDSVTMVATGRALAPELPYAEAKAAEPRLKALSEEDVSLRLPAGYRPTEKDLAAVMAEKPGSARAFIDRGVMLLDEGKHDQAIADFTEALAIAPGDAWALANRGITRAWKDDVAAAERDLASAEAIDPDNPVAARARGLLAERRGDFPAAVEAYSRALERHPRNPFSLMRRATAHHAMGEETKALADSEAALKAGDNGPDLRLLRANIFFAAGNRGAAAREAELLMEQNPDSDFATVAAGRIFARLGMTEQAMKAFQAALAIKPQAYIYVNRAQSRPLSDSSGRLQDLDLALKLEPNHPEALAEKAEQLVSIGKVQDALRLYDRAASAAPDQSRLAIGRAVLLHKLGKAEEAQSVFAEQRRLALSANQLNALCWSKATAGILLESALEECREALKLRPEHGPTIDSLGLVLFRLGRLDEALATYDRAVEKKVGPPSLMGRALVHSAKGEKGRAQADRGEALKLDPDIETRFAEYGLKL